ncbi:hypothetical protein [Fusobacterium sp. PH5-44]|uniref:hypothetical protein n=1 Tax=unclassified Fusobacterium TaxID=2648384 RepID=UPI003D208EBE
MNFKPLLKENKIYVISLIGYVLFQLLSLIIKFPFILFMYFSLFGVSIGSGITNINRNYKLHNSFKTLWINILLSFIANLALTLIYIPTLILNPKVNWTLLDGRKEMDPIILLAAFPSIFFLISVITFIIASILIIIFKKNRTIEKQNKALSQNKKKLKEKSKIKRR